MTGSRSSGVKRAPTRKKSKVAASASQTIAGSRQAATPESNLAATTDSQPSASSFSADASGSDAHAPQHGKSPSSTSKVSEFGRIPKEIGNPRTQEERDESLLAQSLRKKKKYLSDLDKLPLDAKAGFPAAVLLNPLIQLRCSRLLLPKSLRQSMTVHASRTVSPHWLSNAWRSSHDVRGRDSAA